MGGKHEMLEATGVARDALCGDETIAERNLDVSS